MSIESDRNTIISIFEKILHGSNDSVWLNDLFYSNIEDSIIEQVRNTALRIQLGMNWEYDLGPQVPYNQSIRFLVASCGNEIFHSPRIRSLIINNIESVVESEALSHFLQQSSFDDFVEFSNDFIENYSIKSKNHRLFLDLLGVPKSYSVINPKIKRKPLITTRTFEKLNPLLEYQIDVKDNIKEIIRIHQGRSLVVMPTGSGKTRTTSQAFIESISEGEIQQNGILWIAATDELLEQATSTMVKVAESISPIPLKIWRYWGEGNCEFTLDGDETYIEGIVVCGKKKIHDQWNADDAVASHLIENASVIFIDEAHTNLQFIKQLNSFLKRKNSQSSLIGITATPFRRDSREDRILKQIFPFHPITPIGNTGSSNEELVNKMVNEGILARRVDISPNQLGIESGATDMESQIDITVKIIEKLVQENHESILVFTPVVEYARLCNIMLGLKNNLIKTEYLHGGTSGLVRKLIIDDFREKKLNVLFNCEILTTGFDAPKIDAVLIVRPAMKSNHPLFLQMVGRGLRGPKFDNQVKESCTIVHQRW